MTINIALDEWVSRYKFIEFSLDLESLEIDEKVSTVETIHLGTDNLNQTFDFYYLEFVAQRNFRLFTGISRFNINSKTYTIITFETDTVKGTAEDFNDLGDQTTLRMPEYILITDGKHLVVNKLYRRYEESDYYKGITFNDGMNWILFTARFKTTLNRFDYGYLTKIFSKMSQPVSDSKLYIVYNFITSCLRDPNTPYLFVPPVISETIKDNAWQIST